MSFSHLTCIKKNFGPHTTTTKNIFPKKWRLAWACLKKQCTPCFNLHMPHTSLDYTFLISISPEVGLLLPVIFTSVPTSLASQWNVDLFTIVIASTLLNYTRNYFQKHYDKTKKNMYRFNEINEKSTKRELLTVNFMPNNFSQNSNRKLRTCGNGKNSLTSAPSILDNKQTHRHWP